jgi:hypothetical protein
MKALNKAIISYIDINNVEVMGGSNLINYFRTLQTNFTVEDLIHDILEVSPSTYYHFNQQAKKGCLKNGKLIKKLFRLYTYSKTGIWSE